MCIMATTTDVWRGMESRRVIWAPLLFIEDTIQPPGQPDGKITVDAAGSVDCWRECVIGLRKIFVDKTIDGQFESLSVIIKEEEYRQYPTELLLLPRCKNYEALTVFSSSFSWKQNGLNCKFKEWSLIKLSTTFNCWTVSLSWQGIQNLAVSLQFRADSVSKTWRLI